MMFKGLWRLTWLEIKIFVREPMGVFGTVGMPVLVFIVMARILEGEEVSAGPTDVPLFVSDLPILAAVLIAASAVMSLIAIITIYREGGILKRLRATPLRPHTIVAAHVLVKLLFTGLTLALLILAGRRFYPVSDDVPVVSFALALLFSTVSLVSLGFLIASVVPTARMAQPIGTLVIYPMLGLSGLFYPVEALPPLARTIAGGLPFTYAVSLLRGVWHGEGWAAHLPEVTVLTLMLVGFTALASRVFRWE